MLAVARPPADAPRFDIGSGPPPAGFGPATQCPETGAGCVQQHAVGTAGRERRLATVADHHRDARAGDELGPRFVQLQADHLESLGSQQRCLATGTGCQIDHPVTRSVYGGQHEGYELAAFILHGGRSIVDGPELPGISPGQVDGARRPAPGFRALSRQLQQSVAADAAGHQMNQRAGVVGFQRLAELFEASLVAADTKSVSERVDDPTGMRMDDREVTTRVLGVARGRRLRVFRDATHDRVGKACGPRSGGAYQVNGGGHRGARRHPSAPKLIRAEPQRISDDGIDLALDETVERGVEAALGTKGAVGQLGGEGSITRRKPAVSQQLRQQEVGVGASLPDCYEDVEGEAAGGVMGHELVGVIRVCRRVEANPAQPRVRSHLRLALGWTTPRATAVVTVPTSA